MGVRTRVFLACCLFVCWTTTLSVAQTTASGDDLRLADAVKNQDTESVRALLAEGVDVNTSHPDGATPLAWAAYWDDLETADRLIRAGANVNIANELGVTPLSLACVNRSPRIVEKLLNTGAEPNIAQWNGQTPLMTCARTGDLTAVRLLLEHGANVNTREGRNGQTALMAAVARKHADIVQTLIENGSEVNAQTDSGFTALMFAAQQGDLGFARLLVASGADVNVVAPKYGNALTVASGSGHEAVALFLLEKGADSNVADGDGITPLHYAVAEGLAAIISVAPTSSYDSAYKVRPPNMRELAKSLLANGADPDARIKRILVSFGTTVGLKGPGVPVMVDLTPFLLADISADVDLMRILVAGGADPRLSGQGNTTALLAAAGGAWSAYRSEEEIQNALEAVKLVVGLGADVNEANDIGFTPMHAAAYTGADAIVELLAEMGANVNVKSSRGETPWSMAEGISPVSMNQAFYVVHKSTAALLVKLGATTMTSEEIEVFKRSGSQPAYAPIETSQ